MKSRTLKQNRETIYIDDGDNEESAGTRTFFHIEQYGQSGINILESRTLKQDWEAIYIDDRDNEENTGIEIFFHADQYKQSSINYKETRQKKKSHQSYDEVCLVTQSDPWYWPFWYTFFYCSTRWVVKSWMNIKL